jgi:hypothetical protein
VKIPPYRQNANGVTVSMAMTVDFLAVGLDIAAWVFKMGFRLEN